ncbi:MAG: N-6 DNA methylase [Gracilibacteraceae bacterium]|jgi:type I restriction-modification system DNA methylase subunit|nr:N-6 DNA methylase [Gracilibacteraceae bacterium]
MDTVLNMLYHTLDFRSGELFSALESPSAELDINDWLEKGEWLAAAKRAGAEKIFFVENNPVVVFASCGSGTPEKEEAFNRIWCLGRPRLLFLASPGEISVFDLSQKPLDLKRGSDNSAQLKALETVTELARVAELLQSFHRDQIESGKVFGDERFGGINNRADKALIRDLKVVRRELTAAGLNGEKLRYAHALIGRSIFIRYLEDRGIITQEYFAKIAESDPEWANILNSRKNNIDLSDVQSYYARALSSKEFTYKLFRTLAHDFNGDMFPDIDEEELVISKDHLDLIQSLLYGDVGIQKKLFFCTYRFDIVPLDLISSIYEEFYDSAAEADTEHSKARMDGAYYTPTVLAELTVSRVLTTEELYKRPRVMDPACGSGIFLVESFRRMVRFEWFLQKERPSFDALKMILKNRVAGIEINEEAARITAFSLYLALLHYLSPPDITQQIAAGNRLPNLLTSEIESDNHYHCILVGNAFDTDKISGSPLLSKRFGRKSVDVIVSNPPWGSLDKSKDAATAKRQRVMLDWCKNNKKVIGDKEAAQAFLWRYPDFLTDGGQAAVLVSAGVLLKRSPTTQSFRKQWMQKVRIREVYNFSHVRKYFFKGAVSPFFMIVFQNCEQENAPVIYSVAKRVRLLEGTQAISLSKYDIHYLVDEELTSGELWKTYFFGRVHDRRFLLQQKNMTTLNEYIDSEKSGRGYQSASKSSEAGSLQQYKSVRKLDSRYDELKLENPPEYVERFGAIGSYSGKRVLVNEGISERISSKGLIIAQYAEEPFCFYRSIYGLKLKEESAEKYKILLGVLWSSLARYYFFMTSANWGLWHHKLLLDELGHFPIVFINNAAGNRIIAAVDKLRNYQPTYKSLLNMDGEIDDEIDENRKRWETELDNAVFDYYGMTEEQKDLVRDCCNITLPFFYEPYNSLGAMPLSEEDLVWLQNNYIKVFCRRWNAYLDENSDMKATVHTDTRGAMIAVEFFPADKPDEWDLSFESSTAWSTVIDRISNAAQPFLSSSQIVTDGVFHVVSNEAIIIIKRNEKRFWTSSLAREDADITLHRYMTEPKAQNGGDD